MGQGIVDGPGVLHGFSVRRPNRKVLEGVSGVIVLLPCWVAQATLDHWG